MRAVSAFAKEQSRRIVLGGLGILLTGCAVPNWERIAVPEAFDTTPPDPRYGALNDNGYQIPALDLNEVGQDLLRTSVPYASPYRPGTLVVDIAARRLYHVQSGNRATRYAVGVGREDALNFRGNAVVGHKEVWPSWTPTASMVARIPRYAAYLDGMPGGIENPLGARALYLYRDGRDTQFRIHGTNEPGSIGRPVSSGCIRLLNHDVIDLYTRVPIGAPVIVIQES